MRLSKVPCKLAMLVASLVLLACGPSPRRQTLATAPSGEPTTVEKATPEAPAPEAKLVLQRVRFQDLPGWQADEVAAALPALRKSCWRLMKRDDERLVGRDETAGRTKDWREVCAAAAQFGKSDQPPDPSATSSKAHEFFESHFVPFLAKNNDEAEGRFTGYYEASLNGSRTKKGKYKAPLYKRPADLVMVNMREFTSKPGRRRIAGRVVRGMLKPYETRKKIRKGALKGKKLELIWIDDPVDGFFAQIQGSALVQLDDGSTMRIGYAGQNGHSYTAIGRELVRDGHITREEMSMQAIRTWLADNPTEADEMMDRNHAYVFFTEIDGDGPVGSQNVELTAERSAAIDREYIPQSVPLFIDTRISNAEGTGEQDFRQLVIAQDSGGAIRGPVRADIFWGAGPRATGIAGRLKSRGRYYLLLPTSVAKTLP